MVGSDIKTSTKQRFSCGRCGDVHLIGDQNATRAEQNGVQLVPDDMCYRYGQSPKLKVLHMLPFNHLFGSRFPEKFSEQKCGVCGFRHINDGIGQLCLAQVPLSCLNQIPRRDYSELLKRKGLAMTPDALAMVLEEQGEPVLAAIIAADAVVPPAHKQ